jgi:predicted oxidoreductase
MNINYSPLIAGTMNWGAWGKQFTSDEMTQLIRLFFENGIHTFDHADIYGAFTTEAEFGIAFKNSGINRDQVRYITKCGIQYVAPSRDNRLKHYNYSKEYIIWSVEESLKHLKTDYVDVLLLHRPSPLMDPNEIAEAIEILKLQDKILSFGVSNFTNSQTELIRSKTEITVNQIQFSATHEDPMTDGSLDYMIRHQIRPMAWNPLGDVFRTDTEQTRRLKKVLVKLSEKYEVGGDILLLSWVMRHPSGVLPVVGTTNPGRIQQLQKATQIHWDIQDWFEIWVESRGNKVP